MKFKALQKLSVIDYLGKLCTIVFTGGCNFRCSYCHNPELVIGYEKLPDIDEKEVLDLMEKRRGFIDGISITGGEPTIHEELPEFISRVKEAGFLVKLDTNGTNPDMLLKIINNLDYVAMDIKATPSRYKEVIGVNVDLSSIEKSIEIIMNSGVDYEFRTTVFPEFFNKEDAKQIGEWLKAAKRYVLQRPRVIKTLRGNFKDAKLYNDYELREFVPLLPNCTIR
ncbi:MAG TPA: anaerobic ribonucleoside-triphosphate reductase activating protein [bacterium (Candidatus Stahlbacteria)]|nr:anaerobic ribonucleoside-triphosphate reductase activating protein [Candidatus Stahlbacteria bacterium]